MEIKYLYDILHWRIYSQTICTRDFSYLPSNYFIQRYLYEIRREFKESQILENAKKEKYLRFIFILRAKEMRNMTRLVLLIVSSTRKVKHFKVPQNLIFCWTI